MAARKAFHDNLRAVSPQSEMQKTFWGLLLLFFCLPLAVLPGRFVAYEVTPKLVILAVATGLFLLSFPEWQPGLVLLWRHNLGRLFCVLLGLFGVSLTLSTLFSVHAGLSLAGTSWGRYGALTQISVLFASAVCAGYICQRPEYLNRLLVALLISGSIAAVYAILQYFGHDPILDSRLYTVGYTVGTAVRPPATFGHTMYLAAFLLPVTFIAADWAIKTERRIKRIALLLVVILSILAIVLSGARSALLGLLLGFGSACVFSRSRLDKQSFRRFGIVGAVLITVLILIWSSSLGKSLRNRVTHWGQDVQGGARLLVWKDSLSLVREHPVLGHGPETFAEEFRSVESPAFANAYPDEKLQSPNNYFVDIVVGNGLFGFCVALSLLVLAAYAGLKPDSNQRASSSGLLSGFIALVVALQFNPLAVPVAVLLYSLVAILIASQCPSGQTTSWRWTPITRVAAAAGIMLVSAAATLYAVEDSTFADLGKKLARGELARVPDEYRFVSRLPFPKPGQDLWLSQRLASLAESAPGNTGWALSLARQASAVAEQSSEEPFNAFYQSALLALASNDPKEAEKKLRMLLQKAPTWYKPRLLLAQLLLSSGRYTEGIEEGKRAADVAGEHRATVENSISQWLTAADSGVWVKGRQLALPARP
jgi:O-antigen ligase